VSGDAVCSPSGCPESDFLTSRACRLYRWKTDEMPVCSCSVQTGCHLVSVRLSSLPICLHQGSQVALGKVRSDSQAYQTMLLGAFRGVRKEYRAASLKHNRHYAGILQALSVRENCMS